MIDTTPNASPYESLRSTRRALAGMSPVVRLGLFVAAVALFLKDAGPLLSDMQLTWGERMVAAITATTYLVGFGLAGWVAGRLLRAAAELIDVLVDQAESSRPHGEPDRVARRPRPGADGRRPGAFARDAPRGRRRQGPGPRRGPSGDPRRAMGPGRSPDRGADARPSRVRRGPRPRRRAGRGAPGGRGRPEGPARRRPGRQRPRARHRAPRRPDAAPPRRPAPGPRPPARPVAHDLDPEADAHRDGPRRRGDAGDEGGRELRRHAGGGQPPRLPADPEAQRRALSPLRPAVCRPRQRLPPMPGGGQGPRPRASPPRRPPISPRRSRHEHPTHLPFVSRRLLDRRRPAGAIGRVPQMRGGAGGPRHRAREPIGGDREADGDRLGGPRRSPGRRRSAATTPADPDRAGAPPPGGPLVAGGLAPDPRPLAPGGPRGFPRTRSNRWPRPTWRRWWRAIRWS